MKRVSLLTLAAAAAVFSTDRALAQGYAEGFDSAAANVKINADPDTSVTFVDYSSFTIGSTTHSIPEAPRQVAGSAATRGVVIRANLSSGVASTVNMLAAAAPGGAPIPFSGRYRVSFDCYLSLGTGANAPTSGSTEQLVWGAGIDDMLPNEGRPGRFGGTVGTWGWICSENGYGTEDTAIFENGTELADLGDFQPGEDVPFNQAFTMPYSPTGNNAPANSWTRVDIIVDPPNVGVYFNGVKFFDQTSASTNGFAMCGYEDPFNSVMGPSPTEEYGFGLIDNFRVCPIPSGSPILMETDDVGNDTWNGMPETAVCGAAHYGSLRAGGGDHDVWRLTLDCETDVLIYTTARGVAGTCSDTEIDLLDSTGALIENNDDEPNAPGFFSRISRRLAAGTYYIDVYPWTGPATNEGDYALDVVCMSATAQSMPPPLTPSTENEPNNDLTSTDPTACWDNKFATLAPSGDTDFFLISVAVDSIVTFETHADTSMTGAAVGDTKLWLYDNTGMQVAEDDDGGVGLYSKLTYTLTSAGGPYHIEASHWQRNGSGDYRMSVTCIESPFLPEPSVVADQVVDSSSAGCPGTSGAPMAIAIRDGERSIRDSSYAFDVTDLAPGAVVLLGIVGMNSPDIDLAPIGAPGCFYSTTSFISLAVTPTTAGEGEFAVPLVNVGNGLLGGLLEMQCAALDVGANGLGVILSDRLTATIGNLGF